MRLKSGLIWYLVLMLALAGCAAPAPVAPPTTVPAAVAVPTTAPAAEKPAAGSAATEAKPEEKSAAGGKLTVLAAASLTKPFTEIGKQFEAAHPGTKVMFSFAGSQELAQQLDQGAPCDVFASASKKYMEAAVKSGRVNKDDPVEFVRNRLIVIYPKDNPGGVKELKDLAKPGLKLVLADKEVPVGGYSLTFLDNTVKDANFGAAFKDDVLKNVVSYENNVKAVFTKVALGEADAGIVYTSDATGPDAEKVIQIDIPDALNVIAVYPIAPIKDSPAPDLAKAFVELVLSPEGQAELSKVGFITGAKPAEAGAAAPAGKISVMDALGRTVSFDRPPQRIVLTGKAVFMIADAIYMFPEASQRIIATGNTTQGKGPSFIPMIDPDFGKKTLLENEAGTEEVAALTPDVVIMKSYLAEKVGAPLEALGIPVIYIDFETPEQYPRDITTLGQLFQNEARAKELIAFYQAGLDKVMKPLADLKEEQKPGVLLLYYTDKDGTVAFSVPPMGWMQTSLVKTAGGKAIWEDANLSQGWTKVGLEQIAAWDADQIYVVAYFNDLKEVMDKIKEDAQWQSIRAVKEGKLFAFGGDLISWDQPDTRWILGQAWLAKKLHPDVFKDVDITAEIRGFYSTLYGMDAAAVEKDILPNLMGDVP